MKRKIHHEFIPATDNLKHGQGFITQNQDYTSDPEGVGLLGIS